MAGVPASIRYNNPGAMWGKGNKIATKWGAGATVGLNDGLGQGNNIAVFPDVVRGGAAQFDLWRNGYCNLSLDAAIRKWSGGNSSAPYMDFLCKETGLTPQSTITATVLASGTGVKLMKAQAQWEAGRPYPMTDAQWVQAQNAVFLAGKVPASPAVKKSSSVAGGAVATGGVVVGAAKAGAPWWVLGVMFGLGVAVTVGLYLYFHFKLPKVIPPPVEPVSK